MHACNDLRRSAQQIFATFRFPDRVHAFTLPGRQGSCADSARAHKGLAMKSSSVTKSRFRSAAALFAVVSAAAFLAASPASARHGELPNRIPEAAPYDTKEAKAHPPPYDQYFAG